MVLKGMLESTGWLDQIFGNFSHPSYAFPCVYVFVSKTKRMGNCLAIA